MMTKKEVRSSIRKLRDSLTIPEYMKKNTAITQKILSLEEFDSEGHNLLLYSSINNEADTNKIFQAAIAAGYHVGFPRVIGDTMNFYRVTNEDELVYGFFGIREPEINEAKLMNPEKGLVIVPGLAFDLKGNRTGYGRGFYDRYLAEHPGLFKVGIAYDLQVVDELEINAYDIPLDMLVTESQILRFADADRIKNTLPDEA